MNLLIILRVYLITGKTVIHFQDINVQHLIDRILKMYIIASLMITNNAIKILAKFVITMEAVLFAI